MSGLVCVRNIAVDASCQKKKNLWTSEPGGAEANVTAQQDETTGWWTYTSTSSYNIFAFELCRGISRVEGMVAYARLSDPESLIKVESSEIIARGDDWVAAKYTTPGFNQTLGVKEDTSITLMETGVYTPEHWEILKAAYDAGGLERPWFNWDTMPDPRR